MRIASTWPQTRGELADLVQGIIDGTGGERDVDELENQPFTDPGLEAWRQRILREIWHLQFPSKGPYADRITADRAQTIINDLRRNEDA